MKIKVFEFIKTCWYKYFTGKKSLDKRFIKHVVTNPMCDTYSKMYEEIFELRDLWLDAKTIEEYNYNAPSYVINRGRQINCSKCSGVNIDNQCKYNRYLPCKLSDVKPIDESRLNKDIVDLVTKYGLSI